MTVLEAPLFRSADWRGKVVQTMRKGQKIYIHNKHFVGSPLKGQYVKKRDLEILGFKSDYDEHGEFYQTLDKKGMNAYIPKKYVKLIYKDKREFAENITPYKPDPTDYRLEEPLPDDFPLISRNRLRATASLLIGPDIKSSYAFSETIETEDYGKRAGLFLSFLKGADWDKDQKLYFGGIGHIWSSESQFKIFDNGSSTENKAQAGIGPYLSYDFWKTKNYTLTIGGGALINYNRHLVQRQTFDGIVEERFFSGFSITPRFDGQLRIETDGLVDLVLGMDYQIYLSHSLRPDGEGTIPSLWREFQSEDDRWYIPTTSHWSFLIGFVSEY